MPHIRLLAMKHPAMFAGHDPPPTGRVKGTSERHGSGRVGSQSAQSITGRVGSQSAQSITGRVGSQSAQSITGRVGPGLQVLIIAGRAGSRGFQSLAGQVRSGQVNTPQKKSRVGSGQLARSDPSGRICPAKSPGNIDHKFSPPPIDVPRRRHNIHIYHPRNTDENSKTHCEKHEMRRKITETPTETTKTYQKTTGNTSCYTSTSRASTVSLRYSEWVPWAPRSAATR